MPASVTVRSIAGTAVNIALFAAMILGPSRLVTGDWTWRRGWLAVAVFSAETVGGTLFFLMTDQALVRQRLSVSVESSADRRATLLIALLVVGWFVGGASDIHLGPILPAAPASVSLWLGLGIHLVGFAIIVWTFRINSFAAAVVKVQREQRVIDTGPYSIVRHPMYLGAIFWLAGFALLLESTTFALATIPVFVLGFMPRMTIEEVTLLRDLPGYADYQSRVRYRILPGLL